MFGFIKRNLLFIFLVVMLFTPFAGDAIHVVKSTKKSTWESNEHWLEIETSDKKIYRCFFSVAELHELENVPLKEEVIVQNEQRRFDQIGFSFYDLIFPNLNKTLLGSSGSSWYYPKHQGQEVHAIFEAIKNPIEQTLTFKIENHKTFKLYLNDEKDLDGFHNGDEFEILYEESIYEENPLIALGIENYGGPLYKNLPLLILGIKNLETGKEYMVKAEAIHLWKCAVDDRYRVMTYRHYQECGSSGPAWECVSYCYNRYELVDLKGRAYRTNAHNDCNGVKLMVMEQLGENYKVLNLSNGSAYAWSISGLKLAQWP